MRDTDDTHLSPQAITFWATAFVIGLTASITGPGLMTVMIGIIISIVILDWLRVRCFFAPDTPRSDVASFEAALACVGLWALATGIGFHEGFDCLLQ